MVDFKEIAKSKVSGCPLIEGRETIKTDVLIMAYPDGLTLIGGDIFTTTDDAGETKEYGVYIWKEDATHYANAGKMLTEIIKEWLNAYNGDAVAMSKDLEASGGIKIKLNKTVIKGGKSFTNVTIL